MKRVLIFMVTLLIVTSILPTHARAEGLLSDFFKMIKRWFESSPLGNIFSMPVKRIEEIKLVFYPKNFTIAANNYVNITSNTTEIINFKGKVYMDMANKYMLLSSNSPLKIKQKLGEIRMSGVNIGSMEISNMKLVLMSGNWNETTENGSLTIKDFLGECIIKTDHIELHGNASKIIKK